MFPLARDLIRHSPGDAEILRAVFVTVDKKLQLEFQSRVPRALELISKVCSASECRAGVLSMMSERTTDPSLSLALSLFT